MKNFSLFLLLFSFIYFPASAQLDNKVRYQENTGTPGEVKQALYGNEGLYRDFKPENEKTELRNANIKHFSNPDGTITAVIGAGNLHYRENGEWKEILSHVFPNSNNEYSGYAYAAPYNQHKIFFPEKPGSPVLTKLENEIYSDWGQPAMVWLDANANVISEILPDLSANAAVDKDKLTYSNIFPYTDAVILNSVTSKKLSYYLQSAVILSAKPQGAVYLAFRETINTDKSWKLQGSASDEKIFSSSSSVRTLQNIDFFDKEGRHRVEINTPVYFEKDPETPALSDWNPRPDRYYSGSYLVNEVNEGYETYTLVPVQWLTDTTRVFPLVIDPVTNYYPVGTWPTYTAYRSGNGGAWACASGNYAGRAFYYDISYGWIDDTWPTNNPYLDGYSTFDISSLQDFDCINSVQYNWYRYAGRGCGSDITLKFGQAQFNANLAEEVSCDITGQRVRNNNAYYNGTGKNGTGWQSYTGGVADFVNALPSNRITMGWAYNGGDDCCSFLCSGDDGNYHHVYGFEHSTGKPYVQVNYNTASVAASSASASVNPTCPSGTTVLSVSGGSLGTGANWDWYSGGCSGTYIGSGSTISVSPASTTTYYVKASGTCNTTGCVSVTVNVTNTLSVAATSASASVNPTCGGATVLSITGGSLGTGASWQWFSGSCGGTSAGTGASVSVTPASTTTYFVRASGTCNTTVCRQVTVTVNTNSVAPTGATASVNPSCSGSPTLLSPVGGSLGTGANFTWHTGSCGAASIGTGSSFSVSPTSTTTYYVNAIGTCNTTTCQSVTVVVNPLPNGTIGGTTGICTGQSTNLTFNFSSGTGPFNVVYTNGVSNFALNGISSGHSISVSPAGTTTYSFVSIVDANTCQRTSSFSGSATVTVNPLPTVTFSPPGPYCVNGSSVSLTSFGSPAGGLFSGTGVTGAQGSQSFVPSVAGVGSHNLTYTYTDGNGCTNSAVRTVIVNSLPSVTFNGAGGPYCANQTTPISLSGVPSGGTFSGNGVSGSTFIPANAAVGNNVLTYSYTNGNGCTNTATTTVVVTGLPAVSFSGLGGPYCVSSSTPVPLTGNQVNGAFSGPGITPTGPGTVNFIPSAAGVGVHNITFTYTDGNNCTNSQTQSVQVIALPAVTFGTLASSYCTSSPAVQLTGFPSGGTFSGSGVTTGGLFSPSTGAGSYTITYSYTNGNGCTNTTSQSTVVNTLPAVSFSFPQPQYCLNAPVVNLTGSPSGGTFSGPGVTAGGAFTPSTAGLGTHTITYTYTNGNNCSNSTTQQVTIVGVPSVSFTGLLGDYCVNAAAVTLTGNQGTSGSFSGPGITNLGNGTATFSPSVAGIGGSYGITFTYTNGNGCSGTQTQQTVVHPQPVVAFSGLSAEYCVDANPVTLTGSHAPAGAFSGPGVTNNGNGTATFNPTTAGVGGPFSVTYAYTDGFGCSNSIINTTLVNDTPTVFYTGLVGVCIDQPALLLTGVPPGGVFSGTGVSGNAFYPSLSGVGTFSVTYTYNDGNGCEGAYADSVRVHDVPLVTLQPTDVQVCPGDNATFTVGAIGLGLTYQWQVNDGNGFVILNDGGVYSGATTNTLTITGVPPSLDGYQFNAQITGATCSTVTSSNTVTISENPSPIINTHPVDYASCVGDNAVFSVNASGTSLTYQWQVNTGSGFVNVNNGGVYSGALTNTLNITGFTAGMNGYQYRVVVTGTINCTYSSTSNVAVLTATNSPNITTQPVTQSICEGDNAVFTVAATGSGLSYIWQVNTGSGFTTISNGPVYSGATTSTLTVTGVTAAMDGYQYHAIISGSICVNSSTTNTVLINITTSPAIYQQPVDAFVCPGDAASFGVTVQGSGISYQWQVNNGSGFVNVVNGVNYSGATASTLNIAGVLMNMDGYQYRCIINGIFCSGTSTSQVATININGAPVIIQNPADMHYCVGDNAVFSVAANGTGLNYQWQVNNGSGWVDLFNGINYNGVYSNTLTVVAAPLSFDGNLYRVVVSGSVNCSGSSTSSSALLTEDPNPYISSQPADQYACPGDDAVFSVTANGTGLAYQWQVNNGGGFVNVTDGGVYSGATTSSLTITGATLAMDGYTYQAIITGTICTGTSTTNVVTLHSTTSPHISVQPQDQSVCIGDNVTFGVTANGSGLTYQWQVNTGSGFVNVSDGPVYSGSSTSSLLVTGTTLGMNSYQYHVIINGISCPSSSTSADVTLYVGQSPMIITGPSNADICAGFDTSFTVATLGNNLSYQWQVNTGSGFTDIINGGVYSNSTTATLSITGAPVSMNGYQYQVIVTGSINCALTSTSSSAVLTVNPGPVVSFSGLNSQYCVDALPVTLTGVPAGGTFSGPGISGVTFTAATAGVGGPYTILYEYTDPDGCYGSTTYAVTVNALPVVSFTGLAGPYCISSNTPVTLTGTPSGGTFSGTGVTGNTFIPSLAQVGSNTVTYTYTNNNGCVNSQSQSVTVNSLPVVSFTGLNGPYCQDVTNPVTLTGNNPAGTFTASGPGLTDNGNGTATFIPFFAGPGTHTITYTFSDVNGCTNSVTQSVLVNSLPVLTFSGLALQYCITDPIATLTGFPTGGSFSGAGIVPSSSLFDPSAAGLGGHTITYQYTQPSTGCSNMASQNTIVYDEPVAVAGSGGDVCGLSFGLSATPSVGSGTWTSSGPGTASFAPSASDPSATATVTAYGSYTFTWTEDNSGCTDDDAIVVNFYEQAVVSAGAGGSECDLDFTFTGSSSLGTGTWTSSGPGTAFYTNSSSPTSSVMVSGSGIYTFTYTVVNGTCTASDQVTVNFNVLPQADAGPDGSECDLNYTLGAVATVGTGTWTQLSGPGTSTFSPGANAPGAIVTVSVSGTYVFTWTEDNNGCTDSDDATVVFHPLPVVSISGLNAAYCVNETDIINMTGSPSGGIFSGPGVTGTVFDPAAATVGTHTIVYAYTDNFGCSDSHSQTVTVNGLSTTSFTGLALTYCEDETTPVTLTGTPSGGVYSGPGISGNTFTPSVAGDGTHTINYVASNVNGCSNTATQTVTVNVLPVVSFTGLAADYCEDAASATLVSSPVGGSFSGPGISGTTFDPSAAGAGVHIIVCTFTDANGCSNTSSQTVTVHALPVVTTTPSGSAAFCQGSSVLLAASNGFTSYTWSNGNTNQSFLANQTGQYSVDVVDQFGCTGSSAPINVTVNALPVVDLGNDTTICTGNSVVLDPGTFASYLWNPTGSTLQTLTASNNGAYQVTVTDGNGCTGTDQVSVVVASLLQPTVTSSGGSNVFCQGGSLILDAGPGYVSYQWSDGITLTQTMTVTQPGFFSVFVTDTTGCTGVSAPVSITTLPIPTPVILPDGPLAFCPGEDVMLNAALGYTSYQWSPGGETSQSLTVSQAGDYAVRVQDQNGCFATSDTVEIIVYPLPVATISADGPLQFCHGDDVILTAGSGFSSYLWTSGSTTPQITVTESGEYGVTVMDANGCIDSALVANPVIVTVWDPNPSILVSGDTLTCQPAFATYQWYMNDTMITVNGNSQEYVTLGSGNYSVVVTDDHGCTGESDIIEHSQTGIDDLGLDADISIYPNPTRGVFTLSVTFGSSEDMRIELTNSMGQLIIPVEDVYDVMTIKRDYNLNHLANGIYILMIRTDKGYVAKRIVKD